jgi:hypothetical protein
MSKRFQDFCDETRRDYRQYANSDLFEEFADWVKENEMSLAGKVWKTLDANDRYLLLSAAFPNRSDAILDLESQKGWNDLLPSTQQDLTDVDWSAILARNVQPD